MPVHIPDGSYAQNCADTAGVTVELAYRNNYSSCSWGYDYRYVDSCLYCNGVLKLIGIKLGLIIKHANIENLGIYLGGGTHPGDGDNYGSPAGTGWDYAVIFTPAAQKSAAEYVGGSVGEYRPQGDMSVLQIQSSCYNPENFYTYSQSVLSYYLHIYDQNANGISGTLTWAELELTYACYE